MKPRLNLCGRIDRVGSFFNDAFRELMAVDFSTEAIRLLVELDVETLAREKVSHQQAGHTTAPDMDSANGRIQ